MSVSIPFARGRIVEPAQLTVLDGDRPLALQCRPLARWSDGSIKWLRVHLQVDLPGNQSKTLQFEKPSIMP